MSRHACRDAGLSRGRPSQGGARAFACGDRTLCDGSSSYVEAVKSGQTFAGLFENRSLCRHCDRDEEPLDQKEPVHEHVVKRGEFGARKRPRACGVGRETQREQGRICSDDRRRPAGRRFLDERLEATGRAVASARQAQGALTAFGRRFGKAMRGAGGTARPQGPELPEWR